jgi:lysophospholipase L1-like esterase
MSIRARRALATIAASVVLISGSLVGVGSATAVPNPYPTRMAALGDSITQAAMTCSALTSCPTYSWATGTNATVNSHASRIRAAGVTNLVANNYAVSGANSSGLNSQAQKAVTMAAQYVTIEIGANDACTRTVGAMTPVETYRTNVRTALTTLANSSSTQQVFVASVPNLKLMYEVSKSKSSARLVWALLGICQSMLANPTSTKTADVARRDAVQQRVNDYNAVLAQECTAARKCKFDNYAIANTVFTSTHISTRDYFHPSIAGQALIAQVTWTASQ